MLEGERGSITIVAAASIAMGLLLATTVAEIATVARARSRAQAAADAGALAAAQELVLPRGLHPELAAREFAERNGARLVACRCPPGGRDAVVTASVPLRLQILRRDLQVHASARATASAPAMFAGLVPWFAARLGCLFARVEGLSLVSGFRTRQEQARLYRLRPHLAAPPGRSLHEKGLAADLGFASPSARASAHENAPGCGLMFPISYEPWHVEAAGGPTRAGWARPPASSPARPGTR